MYTWRKGFKQLRRLNYQEALTDSTIIADLNAKTIPRLPGTTLFITDPYDEMGGSLLHHLKNNGILTKTVIFVSVIIENKPFTPLSEKFEILQKAEGFYLLNIHYGFAEDVHLPNILEVMTKTMTLPFQIDVKNMAYFVEIIAIEITKTKIDSLQGWQKYLFSLCYATRCRISNFILCPTIKPWQLALISVYNKGERLCLMKVTTNPSKNSATKPAICIVRLFL